VLEPLAPPLSLLVVALSEPVVSVPLDSELLLELLEPPPQPAITTAPITASSAPMKMVLFLILASFEVTGRDTHAAGGGFRTG
jgi:hypothetical protein